MKYFAKYLPVEGEIKEGDMFSVNGFVGPTILKADKDIPITAGVGIKKVKLFLCSRDIQVGDTVIDQVGRKWENMEECFVITSRGWNELHPKQPCYKVIGEISQEATWVKEGDEFDGYEVWWWWQGHFFFKIKEEDESFYTKAKSKGVEERIKVKCPTCKTFH